ncbi:MAG: DUF58 domain-containing protein [Acidobacteria bacterium]|nr:DUF58 domain-containing protein [Acidobacteriota bacterium]
MADLRSIAELFTPRDLRNAVVGLSVVFGGLGLALLLLYAQQAGDARMIRIVGGLSLVFILLIIVFVIPPLAKNAGKEASQLNLPFELTLGGIVMFGLMAVVGFSAWTSGNNLLFLVFSFMAASVVVGFLAGGICIKKLDVKLRFPETIFAGDETPFQVSLINRKRIFPSYSVIAEVRGKEREISIAANELYRILPRFIADRLAKPPLLRRTLDYFVYIARGGTAERRSSHVFDTRGRFLIQDFELSTTFPFGFFRHRRRLAAKETELFVFPTAAPLDDEIIETSLDMGKITAAKRGSGQDLLSLRDYRPNDDLRRVDWKATARTRELTIQTSRSCSAECCSK